MIVDCHVHVCATMPGHGSVSDRLINSFPFRFMRRRLDLPNPYDEAIDNAVQDKLIETIQDVEMLDQAVVLAFDKVYDPQGYADPANTHLYVANDYVMELAGKYSKVLFGASINPLRKDAVAELERCVSGGAVLLKWLPIVQNFNPADEACLPFYEALAHHRLPLLCHTGGEQALPNLAPAYADPMLLVPALQKGVTVIAAHCGTRSSWKDTDYLPAFLRMAREYEHFYGDTSALNLPNRSYAYRHILEDERIRQKLVHGSDWPIICIPPCRVGCLQALRLMFGEKNWLRRDVLTKQLLGFDEAYWRRAAGLLKKSQA